MSHFKYTFYHHGNLSWEHFLFNKIRQNKIHTHACIERHSYLTYMVYMSIMFICLQGVIKDCYEVVISSHLVWYITNISYTVQYLKQMGSREGKRERET